MELSDIRLALRAFHEGEIDQHGLKRFFEVAESWQRASLKISAAEILAREFRINPAKIRRWESRIAGRNIDRIGQYTLKRRIGQGGMGIVFEASHPNLSRPVALKILSPGLGRTPEAIQRFLRESRSAGHFNHPNIVHAYDAGIDGDIPFLVMEYIDGENLFQVLLRQGKIDSATAMAWLRQAASALSVVEAAGWIHGDGKPSNWILAPGGLIKLADHGLCRPPGAARGDEAVYGSPPYIAPEQLSDEDPVDIRADLYSLGATFYHLVTGKPPYETGSVSELRVLQRSKPIVPTAECAPEVAPELARILDRLLAPLPEGRFQSTRELRRALEPPTRCETVVRGSQADGATPWRRRPLGLFLWGVALTGLLAVVGWRVLSKPGRGTPERGNVSVGSGAPADLDAIAGADSRGNDVWQRRFESEPRDYAQLFASLEGAGLSGAEITRRRILLEESLEEEASEIWKIHEEDAERHLESRAYTRAAEAAERFPRRLRVGPYRLAHERALAEIGRRREARANFFLKAVQKALRADKPWHASEVFRRIANEHEEEQHWLRAWVQRGAGAPPWLELAGPAFRSETDRFRRRKAQIRRAVRHGEIPSAQLQPGHSLWEEAALIFLSRNPEFVGERESLVDRLPLESLATLSPGLLTAVESILDEDPRNRTRWLLECTGAGLYRAAQVACRAWDPESAERAWQALGEPRYSGTRAARVMERELDSARFALRQGVFLRSEAFVAEVYGSWDEPPVFAYSFVSTAVFAEWRTDRRRWRDHPDGQITRGGETVVLESLIPFFGSLRVTLDVDFPPPPWVLTIGCGESSIALRYPRTGELLVAFGGEEIFWPIAAAALGGGPRRIELAIAERRWRLELGGREMILPSAAPTGPRWFRLLLPESVVVQAVSLAGRPHPMWLDRRREVYEARQ